MIRCIWAGLLVALLAACTVGPDYRRPEPSSGPPPAGFTAAATAEASASDPPDAWWIGVTLVDGLVVGRSIFESSINYRAVVIHGQARAIDDPTERLAALRCLGTQFTRSVGRGSCTAGKRA